MLLSPGRATAAVLAPEELLRQQETQQQSLHQTECSFEAVQGPERVAVSLFSLLLLSDQVFENETPPLCRPSSEEVKQWRAKAKLLAEWLLISREQSAAGRHRGPQTKRMPRQVGGNDWILER